MDYFETICVKDGAALRLDYHLARMRNTFAQFGSPHGAQAEAALFEFLAEVGQNPQADRQRLRWLYSLSGEAECQLLPYTPRIVRQLQVVEVAAFDYALKAVDRSALDALFALRQSADDVLIVVDGQITDTTIANVALFDGQRWVTPKPLLPGTHRASLIEQGIIHECSIGIEMLPRFSLLRLFNAMLEWGEVEISIDQLIFPRH